MSTRWIKLKGNLVEIPKMMSRDEAVLLGLVSPADGCLKEERKYPYVRITHPYPLEELWMAARASAGLVGCDFISVVDGGQIALFRARGELKDVECEEEA